MGISDVEQVKEARQDFWKICGTQCLCSEFKGESLKQQVDDFLGANNQDSFEQMTLLPAGCQTSACKGCFTYKGPCGVRGPLVVRVFANSQRQPRELPRASVVFLIMCSCAFL